MSADDEVQESQQRPFSPQVPLNYRPATEAEMDVLREHARVCNAEFARRTATSETYSVWFVSGEGGWSARDRFVRDLPQEFGDGRARVFVSGPEVTVRMLARAAGSAGESEAAHVYDPVIGWRVPPDLKPGEQYMHRGVQVTPRLAQRLLDRYTKHRRPLSPQHVERLVWEIESPDPERTRLAAGLYFPAETVSLDRDGQTVAGQHLLHAVIRTGVTVTTDVEFNHPGPPWMRSGTPGGS